MIDGIDVLTEAIATGKREIFLDRCRKAAPPAPIVHPTSSTRGGTPTLPGASLGASLAALLPAGLPALPPLPGDVLERLQVLDREICAVLATAAPDTWRHHRRTLGRVFRAAKHETRSRARSA